MANWIWWIYCSLPRGAAAGRSGGTDPAEEISVFTRKTTAQNPLYQTDCKKNTTTAKHNTSSKAWLKLLSLVQRNDSSESGLQGNAVLCWGLCSMKGFQCCNPLKNGLKTTFWKSLVLVLIEFLLTFGFIYLFQVHNGTDITKSLYIIWFICNTYCDWRWNILLQI